MNFSPSGPVPIAVVGMGCRMPGADNLDEYWSLIRDGRSAIGRLPDERLDRALYFDPAQRGQRGKSYSELGGVVPDRPVNPAICPLPPDLISRHDIAHLTMCEVAAAALRHAGLDPFQLPQRRGGVYIGHAGGSCLAGDVSYSTYIEQAAESLREANAFRELPPDLREKTLREFIDGVRRSSPRRTSEGPELGAHAISNLIVKAFGLDGPSMAVDAACASSLVAMALGVQALQQGEIDFAIVGGASYSKWYGMVLFSMAQSISATGSRPFDADADGLISSDGYAAVVLKPLPAAERDGDRVLAVVRGVGLASDGRGKSLWAPRKEGQIRAIRRAYAAGVDPKGLQYLECHATSTQVGDATELSALTEALSEPLAGSAPVPIGSVKANIGHTLETAGVAGLVKAILAMNAGCIPPQINYRTPNPEIPWNDIPFQVSTARQDWQPHQRFGVRRTAVNAFGIGGLNIHVVLDDRPSERLNASGSVPETPVSRSSQQSTGISPNEPIAVVGMGAITPGALTVQAFWELIASGRDPKMPVPADRWNPDVYVNSPGDEAFRAKTNIGGVIEGFEYDWKKHRIPPKQIANANPLQFMLLDAADQALRDAGCMEREFDREHCAVVVGTIFGGDFACEMQVGLRLPEMRARLETLLQQQGVPPAVQGQCLDEFEEKLLEHMPALMDETGSFTSSTLASRLTKTFDLMGGAFAIDGDDVSAACAISSAVNLLRTGTCSAVLCASGQQSLDVNTYAMLSMTEQLSEKPSCSQLDARADGVVPAEAVGVLLLKRLSDAQRDGDTIRAVIRGIGHSAEYTDPVAAGIRAGERALASAQKTPDQFGFIELSSRHAVQNDLPAVARVWKAETDDAAAPETSLNSLSGQIGHALGTAGMLSTIKATLELEHGQTVADFGLESPEETAAHSGLLLPHERRQLFDTTSAGTSLAAVTSASSSGAAWTMVLEGGSNLPQRPRTQAVRERGESWRIMRLAAQNRAQLRDRLVDLAGRLATVSETQRNAPFDAASPLRLSIVYDSDQTLQTQLSQAAAALAQPGGERLLERAGMYFFERTAGTPRLAFLFPGQGSQYPEMCRPLRSLSPAAAAITEELDRALSAQSLPDCESLLRDLDGQMGRDALRTQLSMLVGDLMMLVTLRELGLEPDVVAGHSYGEIPALVAAGALSVADAVSLTRARVDSIEQNVTVEGGMLSTNAPAPFVEETAQLFGGTVFVANHNAPDQVVAGGTSPAVAGLQRLLEAEGYVARTLAVPRPFHTPLMKPAEEPFRQALQQISMQSPGNGFVSSVTNQPVADAQAVRENLARQLTEPVRYVDLIERIVADGPAVLVEVGPNSVLTKLHRRIVQGKSAIAVATDEVNRSSDEQLVRVRALLEATGNLVSTQSAAPAPSAPAAAPQAPQRGRIFEFDATQRRKERARASATQEPAADPRPTPTAKTPPTSPAPPSAPVSEPPPTRQADAAAPASQPAPQPSASAASAVSREELAETMLEFIVDQTGYPPEMVDFDVDLEADLGIDSIKKAQLIGELVENFPLDHLAASVSTRSLDDFRTLNQILDFVLSPAEEGAAAATEPAASSPAAVAPPPAPEPAAPAPTPPAPVTPPAPPEPVASAPSATPETVQESGGLDRDEVARFMVEYVIDQTGYPAEMVDMEADLEADLGIDSIKKAQLIGELSENFSLDHLAGSVTDLSLDDFPTLEAILDFVMPTGGQPSPQPTAAAQESDAGTTSTQQAADSSVSVYVTASTDVADATTSPRAAGHVTIVECSGSPGEMGRQHGQSQREAILKILQRHTALRGTPAGSDAAKSALDEARQYFAPDELEELRGLADAIGLTEEELLTHNLGMYPDVIPGCSQFAVRSAVNGTSRLIHAANEDSPLALSLPDCLARIVQIRRPKDKLAHLTFSIAGQVAGLNGVNARGVTVSSTLLLDRPRTSRAGACCLHPMLVKRILEGAVDVESALEIVQAAPRFGAWSLCISHFPSDRICYLEYDGSELAIGTDRELVATTNHSLLQSPSLAVPEHSRLRLRRLEQLVSSAGQPSVSGQQAQQILRDRFDCGRDRETPHPTMNTICRVDNQISFVLDPEDQSIWVTPGPMANGHADRFERIDLQQLWQQSTVQEPTGQPATIPAASTPTSNGESKPAGAAMPAASERLMQRWVVRRIEAPLADESTPQWKPTGTAIVLGNGPDAEALQQQLTSRGANVKTIGSGGSTEQILAELDACLAADSCPHLFLMTGREEAADTRTIWSDWSQRRDRGLLLPYLATQKWMQHVTSAGLLEQATLTALVSLGGDFATTLPVPAVEGAGLCGLLKGLAREFEGLSVKAIDVPAEERGPDVAGLVLQELGAGRPEVEVGYLRGRRHILRNIPQPAATSEQSGPLPHGTWVVTGGARGVTAVVARELARRFGLKLHLIGSSPAPDVDPSWKNLPETELKQLRRTVMTQARESGKTPAREWARVERAIDMDRTLDAYRQAGVDATYHVCDVTDAQALEQTLAEIRTADGPIHGIIHGAGIEAACRFDRKQREQVISTIAVKVDAAFTLLNLTQDDPLEHVIGFGSTSGRFGGLGQTDYSLASELLCKLCAAVRWLRPEVRAVGIHWPPWDEIGMAARPESRLALSASGLTFMPPAEGAAHVIDELLAGTPDAEVLFVDRPAELQIGCDAAEATQLGELRRRNGNGRPAAMIDAVLDETSSSETIAETRLDPSQPFLDQHRHRRTPILPVVMALETLCETASLKADAPATLIEDVTIHHGLRFHTDRPQRARVVAQRNGDRVSCELRADFHNRRGALVDPDRLHVEATVTCGDAAATPALPDPGPQPTDWHAAPYYDNWQSMAEDDDRVFHGPPFTALKEMATVADGGWGRIVAADNSELTAEGTAAGWALAPATLDACLLAADVLTVWRTGYAPLPQSFGSIRLLRPIAAGEELTVRLWHRDSSESAKWDDYDFTLYSRNGEPVVAVTGYRSTRVSPSPGTPDRIRTPDWLNETASATSAEDSHQADRAEVPSATGNGRRTGTATMPATATSVAAAPLIRLVTEGATSQESLAYIRLDPTTDPFLTHHLLDRRPILPAVVGLEAMVEAAAAGAPPAGFTAHGFKVHRPLRFPTDEPTEVRVRVHQDGNGASCRLESSDGATLYQQAEVVFDSPDASEVPELVTSHMPMFPFMWSEENRIYHGDIFRCLEEVIYQRDGGWGRIYAADPAQLFGDREGDLVYTPAATLDSCLVTCGADAFIMLGGRQEMPMEFERMQMFRMPASDEQCMVRIFCRAQEPRHTMYDFTLYGEDGTPILDVAGYRGGLINGTTT
ncbi:Phthiocerol/phenolphthiocerol synthesis polyketide synthase type I PpsA [Maioricimonas rarisocia]|uniref:Phthiocerol/phenolphthiocerol synthesis polyketide synthase type I PpsA n=1 Tax=Maioricimonas rarisocia TaxID=2528026 RepID=A0A517ZDI9_9PLAN|nr:type I polyketide synthase [Maioricimonas rarisocia]QDU40500.1 Phthiocerol/phenolphthiocerol synthesis polyketide synthase type I PpsA [Maioricimonas rarisocia]